MNIVEFDGGDLILNWDDRLPQDVLGNIKLRDKILEELKNQFSNIPVDTKVLFQMNKYVINRLKHVIHNRTSNKNS